jgi:CheY-like chemotaxis protein
MARSRWQLRRVCSPRYLICFIVKLILDASQGKRRCQYSLEPMSLASGTTSVALSTDPAGRSILIVEDNRFVARQCRSALLAAGFKVIGIVTTADAAIQVALERRPRLILMDIYLLGERDGVDAAIEIFQRRGIGSMFASAPPDAAGKARVEAAQPYDHPGCASKRISSRPCAPSGARDRSTGPLPACPRRL